MNKLFFWGITILFLTACKKENKVDYVLFSGHVEDKTSDTLYINKDREIIKKIVLSEKGDFVDTLRVEKGQYFIYMDRDEIECYLIPGLELKLNVNAEKFDETIVFSGEGRKENNYLAKKYADRLSLPNGDELNKKKENEYLNVISTHRDNSYKLLKLLEKENGNPEFINQEKKRIHRDFISKLFFYPYYHRYNSEDKDYMPSKKLNTIIKNGLDTIEYTDENKTFLRNYYVYRIQYFKNTQQIFDEIKKIKSSDFKENIASKIHLFINQTQPNIDVVYKNIKAMSIDESLKSKLLKKCIKIKSTKKGNISPDFVFENSKGDSISLKSLRGKFVYIDFWATWCHPCIEEQPFFKKLEKKFHKDVAFVSISIDRDKKAWKAFVKEKKMEGIQLYCGSDFDQPFRSAYGVLGIPHFILIDRQGKVISPYALKPSDNGTIKLLDDLIAKKLPTHK